MQDKETTGSIEARKVAHILRSSAWTARKNDDGLSVGVSRLGDREGEVQIFGAHDSHPATQMTPRFPKALPDT